MAAGVFILLVVKPHGTPRNKRLTPHCVGNHLWILIGILVTWTTLEWWRSDRHHSQPYAPMRQCFPQTLLSQTWTRWHCSTDCLVIQGRCFNSGNDVAWNEIVNSKKVTIWRVVAYFKVLYWHFKRSLENRIRPLLE